LLFKKVEGKVDSENYEATLTALLAAKGRKLKRISRYYANDELIFSNGNTYALTKKWGGRTEEAIQLLLKAYPDKGVSYRVSE